MRFTPKKKKQDHSGANCHSPSAYRLRVPVQIVCVISEGVLELDLELVDDRLVLDPLEELSAQVRLAARVACVTLKERNINCGQL